MRPFHTLVLLLLILALASATAALQATAFVRMTLAQPENVLRLLYRHGFFAEIQGLLDRSLAGLTGELETSDLSAARTALRNLMAPERVSEISISALSSLFPAKPLQSAAAMKPGLDLSWLKKCAMSEYEAAGASTEALLLAASALGRLPDHVELSIVPARVAAAALIAPAAALGVSVAALALILTMAGTRRGLQWTGAALVLGGVALVAGGAWLRSGLDNGLMHAVNLGSLPLEPPLVPNLQGILSAAAGEMITRASQTSAAVAAAGLLLIALPRRLSLSPPEV